MNTATSFVMGVAVVISSGYQMLMLDYRSYAGVGHPVFDDIRVECDTEYSTASTVMVADWALPDLIPVTEFQGDS